MSEFEKKNVTDMITQIIPEHEIIKFQASISDRSYSIEFHAIINEQNMQCYEMVDNGIIEETDLDICFKKIANYLRSTNNYSQGIINKFSFSINK